MSDLERLGDLSDRDAIAQAAALVRECDGKLVRVLERMNIAAIAAAAIAGWTPSDIYGRAVVTAPPMSAQRRLVELVRDELS